jgi:MoxR-like ATPase
MDPTSFPWDEITDPMRFGSAEWTERILRGLSVYDDSGTRVVPARREVVCGLLAGHVGKVLERLHRLEARLNESFVGKEKIIRMILVCAIAQQPLLPIGPPGTAKSKIITRFCEALGIGRAGSGNTLQTLFQYLLHSFTEPDEILGPVNLARLNPGPGKRPRFRRFRKGSLTDADVIFLDEVFRANSAILNSLLTVINERRVYEGGKAYPARARLIFAASNSVPTPRQMEELRAFYERFIIRLESQFIPLEFGSGNVPPPQREELLRRGWESEVRDLRASYDPEIAAIAPLACLNDILLCNRAVTELWGGEHLDTPEMRGFSSSYHRAVASLGGGNARVSVIDDRKFIRLFVVVRAHALFVHLGPPNAKDLAILEHTWEDLSTKELAAERVGRLIRGQS